MHACLQGYEEDVRLILQQGVKTSHKQIVPATSSVLAYRGTKQGIRETFADTALIFAARRSFAQVIEILVEEGRADVNLSGSDGMTPLMWCAYNGNLASVAFLVDHGAKINRQSEVGAIVYK